MSSEDHVKVLFRAQAESHLPGEIESLWAIPVDRGYRLDNVPFHVREIAYRDIVAATRAEDGELWFEQLIEPSGHSTIRIWFSDHGDVGPVRQHLETLGCSSELSELVRLVAVDVPPEVDLAVVRQYLDAGETSGRFEYEEGCVGQ